MENKQFEEWLLRSKYNNELIFTPYCVNIKETSKGKYEVRYDCRDFYLFPFEMQWGVYLEFFDSVGITTQIETVPKFRGKSYFVHHVNFKAYGQSETRKEAQQEAIKKAFEILELSEAGKKGAKAGEEMRDNLLGK